MALSTDQSRNAVFVNFVMGIICVASSMANEINQIAANWNQLDPVSASFGWPLREGVKVLFWLTRAARFENGFHIR